MQFSVQRPTPCSWLQIPTYPGYIWCVCMLRHFSHVWFFATPCTVGHQAPLSMEFSRREYWSGLPCPPPGDLSDWGIEPASLMSLSLAGGFLITNNTWEAWLFLELSPISLSYCKTVILQLLFLSQQYRLQNILFAIIYKFHWIYIYIFFFFTSTSNHLVLAVSSNVQALPRYWGRKFPESLSPVTSMSICCLLSIWFPKMLSYLVYNALIINQFVFAI